MQPSNHYSQHRRRKRRLNAEINVTPYVDVVLVLLIIFMVASPMLVSGIISDIPKGTSKPIAGQDESVKIEVGIHGRIYLQEQPVAADELITKLKAVAKNNQEETRIFVRGHRHVDYERVIRVIDTISSAGFNKVALVTDPDSLGTGS